MGDLGAKRIAKIITQNMEGPVKTPKSVLDVAELYSDGVSAEDIVATAKAVKELVPKPKQIILVEGFPKIEATAPQVTNVEKIEGWISQNQVEISNDDFGKLFTCISALKSINLNHKERCDIFIKMLPNIPVDYSEEAYKAFKELFQDIYDKKSFKEFIKNAMDFITNTD